MGETTDQIERHICEKRRELGENIHELQHKVKDAVNWRVQVQERPCTMVGLAFGAGVVASLFVPRFRRSSSRRPRRADRWNRESSFRSRYQDRSASRRYDGKASQVWGTVKGAVAAVAIAKAKDFLEEVIPGFGEQYRKHESRRNLLGSSYEHRSGNGPAENESVWQSSRRVRSEYARGS